MYGRKYMGDFVLLSLDSPPALFPSVLAVGRRRAVNIVGAERRPGC